MAVATVAYNMAEPIQDIASSPAQPTATPSEPEIVSDIPVRAPVTQPDVNDKVSKTLDHDSDFIPSGSPKEDTKPAVAPGTTTQKDQEEPKTKDNKPKPIFAIAVASAAIISLAAGAYLKFINGS